jgi:hypothetical protein
MTNCALTGTVYNLPDSINAAEIVLGSTWNGASDPSSPGSGIDLTRDNTTQINVGDYIK